MPCWILTRRAKTTEDTSQAFLGQAPSQGEDYCEELVKATRKRDWFNRHLIWFLIKEESMDIGESRHGTMKKPFKMKQRLLRSLDLIGIYRPELLCEFRLVLLPWKMYCLAFFTSIMEIFQPIRFYEEDAILRKILWLQLLKDKSELANIRILQWTGILRSRKLHAFTDDSESAYAAAVYLGSLGSSGEWRSLTLADEQQMDRVHQQNKIDNHTTLALDPQGSTSDVMVGGF